MAERRKNRRRKDDIPNPDGEEAPDKPAKEEYAVAKWIRNNVPSKKTKFLNHNVEYFTGSRAVDALLEKSPWSKTQFETREQITDFLDAMLRHKFFHRAKKVVVSEKELNIIRGAKKKGKDNKEEKKSVDKEKEKDKEDTKESKESGDGTKEGDDKQDERKEQKKKPKIRLEMHLDQYFADCNDAYVWIYEPIPAYYWLFGTLVVLGAIGVCLFPLWPPSIRQGVYYLSVAAAGFLVFILVLAVVRLIVFSFLWVITLGRHHLWFLPNLAEDVGFFASFWPLYHYEYCGPTTAGDKKLNKKKKRKKDKDSDAEDTPLLRSEETSTTTEAADSVGAEDTRKIEIVSGKEGGSQEDEKCRATESAEGEDVSEEGSESEKSNTSRDFEMVQHTELEDK
ncbi:translocation protein SEC62 isoform X2 [Cephus cinctus]|uniref:Translocation protein SEC62 n=1 Tax=Cephus cinctus TaxID=211228 RepID=A0AAJ7FL83_CEPCN|nr:translocation protein SEC62 isoform X2 [Cephus cinctus]